MTIVIVIRQAGWVVMLVVGWWYVKWWWWCLGLYGAWVLVAKQVEYDVCIGFDV